MQITGAFLAEHAEVVDQKLNVTGGVFDSLRVPRLGVVDENGDQLAGWLHLVVLLQASQDDLDQPQESYRLTVEVVLSTGETRPVGDIAMTWESTDSHNRFWQVRFPLAAERDGRMVLMCSVDGGVPVSVPLHLTAVG